MFQLARFLWASCMVAARGGASTGAAAADSAHFSSEQLLAGDDGEAEWRRSYPKVRGEWRGRDQRSDHAISLKPLKQLNLLYLPAL